MIERGSGDYLGRVGLRWTEVGDRAGIEVLWAIDPGRHGEGFAGEAAAAALDVRRRPRARRGLRDDPPINAASLRVAEKIGMDPTGEVEHAGSTTSSSALCRG